MKNFGKKLLALVLAITCLFAFACCGNGDKLTGTTTIVLDGSTEVVYTLDLEDCGFVDGDNVYQALVWLNQNKGVEFNATTSFGDNGYDAYINSIGDLNPAYGSTQYVALFHNVESQKDVSAWAQPDRQYKDTTVYYSGVGVGALKLCDGLVVYLTLLSY